VLAKQVQYCLSHISVGVVVLKMSNIPSHFSCEIPSTEYEIAFEIDF
jgi:hypothetical protein